MHPRDNADCRGRVPSPARVIRALDAFAPASYGEFTRLASIADEGDRPDATEMIRRLAAGQRAVVTTAKSIYPAVDRMRDEPTTDLLTGRIRAHEKSAWMLRSLLA